MTQNSQLAFSFWECFLCYCVWNVLTLNSSNQGKHSLVFCILLLTNWWQLLLACDSWFRLLNYLAGLNLGCVLCYFVVLKPLAKINTKREWKTQFKQISNHWVKLWLFYIHISFVYSVHLKYVSNQKYIKFWFFVFFN